MLKLSSLFFVKSEDKLRKFNKIRQCFQQDKLKSISFFFFLKKSLNFMRKIRVNKGNETKSNIFPQDAFEFDFDFFGQKIFMYFSEV